MKEKGPLLASGRDAEIYEYGNGLVLRRSRDGRSITGEAQTMAYLRQQGYPVPAVETVSEDGCDLVMERIDGPSMVASMARFPWTVPHCANVLADLHLELHSLASPAFLRPAPVGRGTCIVHLDLHPLNVIMGRRGPVVIDWSSASCGDPAVDVALAWVLAAVGEIPGPRAKVAVLSWLRGRFVDTFLARFSRQDIAPQLHSVVTWKAADPHMSPKEIDAMWQLVDRATRTR